MKRQSLPQEPLIHNAPILAKGVEKLAKSWVTLQLGQRINSALEQCDSADGSEAKPALIGLAGGQNVHRTVAP